MRQRGDRRVVSALFLLGLCSVCLAPILYMILLSFLTQASFISTQSLWSAVGEGLTIENYKQAFARTQFGERLILSVQTTGIVALIVAIVGLPAAHAIARFPHRKATQSALIFFSVRLLPAIAVSIPVFGLFNRPGVVRPWLSLSFIHVGFNLPILIWLAVPVFQAIPKNLEDLVLMDGISRIKSLVAVVVPMVYKRLAGAIMIVSVLVWNESFFASIFRVDTVTEVIPSLIGHRGVQWGLVMAVGTMVTVPGILLLLGVLWWRRGLEPWEE